MKGRERGEEEEEEGGGMGAGRQGVAAGREWLAAKWMGRDE